MQDLHKKNNFTTLHACVRSLLQALNRSQNQTRTKNKIFKKFKKFQSIKNIKTAPLKFFFSIQKKVDPTGLEPIIFLYERNVITILTMGAFVVATGLEPAKNKF